MRDYMFNYIEADTYELVYTNKDGNKVTKRFTRDVQLARDLERVEAKGRLDMLKEMTKQGISKDDLVIKTTKADGSIIYDESNFREYEQYYVGLAGNELLNDVCKRFFDMSLVDLFTDMGIDVYKENEKDTLLAVNFGKALGKVIKGDMERDAKIPSSSNKEQQTTANS